MNRLEYQKNVIATDRRSRHDIRRYEFKALEFSEEGVSPVTSIASLPTLEDDNKPFESIQQEDSSNLNTSTHENTSAPVIGGGIEAEVIERLLERSDGLVSALETVQAQLDRQQEEMEKILREAKEEAKIQGIREGEEKARAELQDEINAQLQAFGDSIVQLGETSLKMEEQIGNIEKDLSVIAVDIAKEVIAKEVAQESSEIALSLSKRLLESLKEATKILIKLNPQDYAALSDRFDGDERIKLQADKAISRGGVVVISDSGNLDGTIMSRFENLKRSILEGSQG